MIEIGQEISEQLDIVPMQIRVKRHIRKRYGCPVSEHAPVLAALPPQPLPKSNASPDFLAMLLIVKYIDGLPLTRFEHVLKGKLLAGIEAAGLTLPSRYPKVWIVNCKSVGTGEKALIYLGRYLYRGVIREKDIVACRDGQVTFCYRNARTGKMERRTVPGAQFLWLVLQHVLPKGFRRARNFGFLHPNCKRLIVLLHVLLKFNPRRASDWIKERAPILCSCCGTVMKIVQTRLRSDFPKAMPPPIVAQGVH